MSADQLRKHVFGILWLALLLAAPGVGFAAEPAKDEPRLDRYGDPLPPGAVTRLGTVRYRHGKQSGAFLPDSKTVVSTAEAGNAINFWDARNGRLLREIDTGKLVIGWYSRLALSRDGKCIALTGSVRDPNDKSYHSVIGIFDVVTGKELRVFEREPVDSVQDIALTSDGKFLISIGRKGALRIEEIATGTEFLRHQFPRDSGCIALSSDDSTLALGTGPNTRKLVLWKWQGEKEPHELKTPDRAGECLALSPDGKLLAEANQIEPSIRLWDTENGRLLRNLELTDGERYRNRGLAFAPDSKTLAANVWRHPNSEVHLWETGSGKLRAHLPLQTGPMIRRIEFSPDGRLLVVGHRVWDVAAGRDLSANAEAHQGCIEWVITGDKDLVVTTSDDHTARVWDGATSKHLAMLRHGFWIRGLALSPDQTRLATNSLDDTVCLWDTATGRNIFRLAGHGKTGGHRAVAFTPDGKHFLSWGDDMYLRKWDTATGKAVFEALLRPTGMPVERDMLMELGNGTVSADGRLFVLATLQQYFVFDTSTGKELRVFPATGSNQMGLALSPDSKLLLTSAYGTMVQTKLPDGRTRNDRPDSHLVCLWDLSSGKVTKQIVVPVREAGAVAFSADGKLIAEAAGYTASSVRVWEAASGNEVYKLEGVRGGVRTLAFMPDGKRLVTGMEDSTALVWDLTKNR
jgi:WD40 repeat protein